MANADSLAQQTGYNVGRYLVSSGQGISVDTAGNAVANLAIMSGGLTNGGGVANSGGIIVRQVTFQNPSKDISTANVAILTSNDGNTSNALVSIFKLSNISATGRYQDGNVAAAYASNVISGSVTQAFYFYVANSTTSGGTVDVKIYGDIVNF
jgi:hypothetical protein